MKNLKRNIKNSITDKNPILSLKEDAILLASAKIASSKAIRSSIALGITFKVIRGHEIIAISPDKSIKVIRKLPKPTIDVSTLKKGMVLERK